jgi:hypothetical protein
LAGTEGGDGSRRTDKIAWLILHGTVVSQ